jgi:small ligand-binding sensory domain FIST
MRWRSALSELTSADAAIAEATTRLQATFGDVRVDLLVAFVSAHHSSRYDAIPKALEAAFPSATIVGCSAGGVIGAGHEVEDSAAISLTGASLPGVAVRAIHLDGESTPEATASDEWRARIGLDPAESPHFLLLVDPFSADAAAIARGLDGAYPNARKIGGLASGGRFPGANALFLPTGTRRHGAIVVVLSGDVEVDAVVAQGCRPIGEPMMVTRCHGNLIEELDRRPPLSILRVLYETLSARDQGLFRHALFCGIETKDDRVMHRAGELLVRNIVGVDPKSGAVAIGATPHAWQVVQFLLRDAETAREDLERHLTRYRTAHPGGEAPEGALLFSCLGRGSGLFGRSDHDTDLFRAHLGDVPLGGFFCNGEIGPVGAETYLHGYTSAFGLFRPRAHKSS